MRTEGKKKKSECLTLKAATSRDSSSSPLLPNPIKQPFLIYLHRLSLPRNPFMGLPRFTRPKGPEEQLSPNLYVANCGPAVGLSFDTIGSVFGAFGEMKGVYAADESGGRVIVCYFEVESAQAAMKALNGRSCPDLGGRSLHIRYSVLQPTSQDKVADSLPVALVSSELNIPGLYSWPDFVSCEEEMELLAAVDCRPWKNLAKRRVQHYGYEFCYETRNIDANQNLGEFPSFVSSIVERMTSCTVLDNSEIIVLDQLTVNEYPPGVGLSPHIDTHSAFEGLIFIISLAGPCIMEFRRYFDGSRNTANSDMNVDNPVRCSQLARRAVYLPPRSMLLLSGEARYAWQHYIPHHKIDMVNGSVIRRGTRRVSFTFRKIRRGPCQCEFPQYCDSQS